MEYGVDRYKLSPKILDAEKLNRVLAKNQILLDISRPIIDELYGFHKENNFLIILADKRGCILYIKGNEYAISATQDLNIRVGTYMDEKSIGTNGIGTSLAENGPVQISGDEHFSVDYHTKSCTAAPIREKSGQIIGVLNLTDYSTQSHPNTMGLVVTAVKAIESHFQNINIQKQLQNSNEFAFAMMNSLSYGMFAIDLNDDILWVNDAACRFINIRRLHLINISIKEFFPDWDLVRNSILTDQPYIDEEAKFNISELKEKFLFNAYPIKTKDKEILGFILSFRELSRVLKIIKKYAGFSTRYTFDYIVGESPKTKALIKNAKTVAKNFSTVLITGESGTGKEIIAQSLHHASRYRNASFVAVNCGAIAETLIESELFGYVEGAFTGAKKGGSPGKFELADGGTLFLDEIGEMPLNMQVKLLRVLQEKTVYRVGSSTPIYVNVRIIAATNKNLTEELAKGTFRFDLYYRLNVIEINVPPLRERKEDIVPLARFFLKKKAAIYEKTIPELDAETINQLILYKWPGNVRELENFIERAVIFDGRVNASSLLKTDIPNDVVSNPKSNILPESWRLEDMEKELISKALVKFDHNISKIAEVLGVSRNTLYLKMKKYNLSKVS